MAEEAAGPEALGPDGPEEAGVAHINRVGLEHFKGVMHCTWTPTKGRVLHATRAYRPGEVILVESPLHIVQEQETCAAFKKLKQLCEDHEDDFDHDLLWYWCAIQSLTEEQLKGAKVIGCTGSTPEQQKNLLLLHHEEVEEPSAAAEIIAREIAPTADPVTIERLIQIWILNCYEYSDNPQGYSIYFYFSFMSHSCFPNAVWHYTGTDHVLRSRREIQPGDEVCYSYLPESGLLQSAPSRRMELNDSKRFWCDCERCREGILDNCRCMRCVKCSEGQLFAMTPNAGVAKDASLLVVHWVGAECQTCKHVVTKTEAQKLAALEKQLQDIVDKYTESESTTVKQLQENEAFIDQHFAQHVLADLAWEQFCSHYARKRRMADQRRLLQRRCAFHKGAYPGLSGEHAWALEALGDCMRQSGGDGKEAAAKDSKEATKKGKGTGNASALQRAPAEPSQAAKDCYQQALAVLRLMFGNDLECVTDVEAKLAELN